MLRGFSWRQAAVATLAAAGLLLGSPSASAQSTTAYTPSEEDSLLLQLQVRNLTFRSEIRGYQTPNGVCVDLADVIQSLDLPIRLDKKSRRATGWIFSEDQKFSIDRDSNRVQIVNNARPLQPSELYDTPEGWCVDTDSLGGWFGVSFTTNMRASTLVLESDRPLPFLEARERQSRAARLRGDRDTTDLAAYPQARQPYAMWRLPSVDVVARADYSNGSGNGRLNARYEVYASGEIARASYAMRLASDSEGVPQSLRAVVIGEAATLLGRADRFDEALAQLDRAAAIGAEGTAQAEGRRGEILGRWIAALAANHDAVGLATVYAAHTTAVQALASVEDRATVARALAEIGLHESAVKLLSGTGPDATAETALALAEEAVAARDAETAARVAAGLDPAALPSAMADRVCAVRARAALLKDGPRAAAAEAAQVKDLELRATIAAAFLDVPGGASEASALLMPLVEGETAAPVRVLLIAGAAALAEGAWDAAAVSYENAILRGAVGAERIEALAGLLRAADADGDAALVTAALSHVGPSEDVIVRRVAATLKRRLRRSGGPHGA